MKTTFGREGAAAKTLSEAHSHTHPHAISAHHTPREQRANIGTNLVRETGRNGQGNHHPTKVSQTRDCRDEVVDVSAIARLTDLHAGRDDQRTDVHGRVVDSVLA